MLRCGLLGRKLGHSYSPAIHRALGDYEYGLFELEPEELSDFLREGNFHGLNVTIPYKTAVLPYCKELSPRAAAVGSVNTILRRADGSLYGDNTDIQGFEALVQSSGLTVKGKKTLVLGSGGASLTVCHVLEQQGAGEVLVISRQGEHHYGNLDLHRDAQILVNTTPLGMYPDTGVSAVDVSCFPALEGVLDLIYNPARTRLLLQAEGLGIPNAGGLPMLVGQARAAAELFTGQEIEADREREVLQKLRSEMENIILIGMPGCGKSTVGKVLARRLGRKFVDADRMVEAAAGLSIPEIFKTEGEAGFRVRETEMLERLGKQSGLVISTGGGCVTRAENYPLLRQNGTLVFVERDTRKLPREGRPLSQKADLEALYQERLPLYRRFANCSVRNNTALEIVAARTWEAVYEALGH